MHYPSIETAPKDGSVIWAGGEWMVYGRPWKWCETLERWLCWFGVEQGFVRVSGEPKHWAASLTQIANEIVNGEREMPFQADIRRPPHIYTTLTC
jgi:hypothetical protein